jgi:hypothetical protein
LVIASSNFISKIRSRFDSKRFFSNWPLGSLSGLRVTEIASFVAGTLSIFPFENVRKVLGLILQNRLDRH